MAFLSIRELGPQANLHRKVSVTQYADRCFVASLRDHGEFYLARLDIKHRISEIALDEDYLFLRKSISLLPSPILPRN
jgi:hypothetical protein